MPRMWRTVCFNGRSVLPRTCYALVGDNHHVYFMVDLDAVKGLLEIKSSGLMVDDLCSDLA